MDKNTQALVNVAEGDTLKAVVSDPTYTALGTVLEVNKYPDGEIVAKSHFFRVIRRVTEEKGPILYVNGENEGQIEELEVL